jgi:two-component system sensor histidine kinase KdpD
VDAILARKPEVVLVDELAHTNAPGARHEKRWQDVRALLDAGITVISTLNIEHLESLNDVVERITGIVQRETIPDQIVRAADQVELVDMTPEALRRRMAHGNIYAPEKVDAALGHYFRVGNLAALRELALLWVADRVDESLEAYRERHSIRHPWETRERVVVAITGAPGSENLIRRAARIAKRHRGALIGVHVESDDGLAAMPAELLARHRRLLEELGGEYRRITGADVAGALVDFARAENATQLVLGASSRSRWQELTRGSVINRAIRLSGPIDVHVISAEPDTDADSLELARRRPRLAALSPRRQLTGFAIAAVGLPLVTVALAHLRSAFRLSSVLLIYLVTVMAVAVVGGALPALAAAVGAFLLANWYFTPPFYRWEIGEHENLLALLAFVLTAGLVSYFVDLAARRATAVARARAEAEAMARLAGSLAEEDVLPRLVEQLRATFGVRCAAVLRREGSGWVVEAASGTDVPSSPADAEVIEELAGGRVFLLAGGDLRAENQRVLNALVAQLGLAIETRRLQGEAARARTLAEANDLRAALLQAVSHDLRTPLASIKASITSLRQKDIVWTESEEREFQETIEEETDRLDRLVDNLLDMSRLQAGALHVTPRPTGLDEVVPAALAGLGERARPVVMNVEEGMARAMADAALLERVVANLVENALNWSDPDQPVRVEAGAIADQVDLRVVDRGPGIPMGEREQVFRPFQRLADHGSGVGLGLAVARGFVEAMGGELVVEDTPGGGTTMVVTLARAPEG